MTTQLYPSPKFKSRIEALGAAFSIEDYVDCFLVAENPVEQTFLFESVSFQSKVNELFTKEEGTLERVRIVWNALETFGKLIAGIDPADVAWDKKFLAEQKEKRKSGQEFTSEERAISDALDDVLEGASSREQDLISRGYNHLPPRPLSTLLITQFEESVTKELGFNLFGGFNQHLADLEKALPRSKAGNREKVSASPTVRLTLFEQWTVLNKTFNTLWADSVQQIAEALDCPKPEEVLHKVKNWGAGVAEWNRRAGGIALFGSKAGDHLKFEDTIVRDSAKVEVPQVRLSEKEANDKWPEAATDFISVTTEAFRIPGVIDVESGVLAMAELKYTTWLFSDFTTSPIGGLFLVSPLLVPSIRDISLDSLRRSNEVELSLNPPPTLDEIEKSGFLPLCFLCYSPSREDELDIESLFRKLELKQRPISDPIFFEVISSRFEDCWDPSEEILQEGINRLNRILRGRLHADKYPEGFDSIYGLGTRLGFPAPSIVYNLSNETDICGLFLLAAILNEDEYDNEEHLSGFRSDEYLHCVKALLDDGFVDTAGFVFCYYLVTEAWEVITYHTRKLKEDPTADLERRLHPIGDWREICDIASSLSSLGWSGRIQRTFALSAEYLEINEVDQLRFSVSQLRALSGFHEISDEGKKAAKAGFNIVEFQPHLRTRLIDVMGDDAWKMLSTELQKTLVRLERKYEIGLGDASAYGGRESTWALDWSNLVEGMLKEKLQILWNPDIANNAARCLQAIGKGNMEDRFKPSTAVFICQGATKIGDAMVLERLKRSGCDPYAIGDVFGKNLVTLLGKRNKITHPTPGEDQTIKQKEAEAIRIWVIENIFKVIEYLGLKKRYFANN